VEGAVFGAEVAEDSKLIASFFDTSFSRVGDHSSFTMDVAGRGFVAWNSISCMCKTFELQTFWAYQVYHVVIFMGNATRWSFSFMTKGWYFAALGINTAFVNHIDHTSFFVMSTKRGFLSVVTK
jgi:hypothetical protein